MVVRIGILWVVSLAVVLGETTTTMVDSLHDTFSRQVHTVSNGLDGTLASMFDDSNTSINHFRGRETDRFFRSDKFLEETNASYVKLRVQQEVHSLDPAQRYGLLSASLPFSESNRRFHLFVDGTPDDLPEGIENDALAQNAEDPAFGFQYLAIIGKVVKSKYLIGLRGISPFVRWRYSYRYRPSLWRIEPVQTFEYSARDKFSERTDLYFDRPIGRTALFRLAFNRGTTELKRGMAYGGRVEWYWRMKPGTQIKLFNAYYGQTEYEYTSSGSGEARTYNGIYTSEVAAVWRQTIWRKWFFYEVSPGVDYQKRHEYHPNYRLFVAVDLYFGATP